MHSESKPTKPSKFSVSITAVGELQPVLLPPPLAESYWLTNQLVVGPTPFNRLKAVASINLNKLLAAKITTLVSTLSGQELLWWSKVDMDWRAFCQHFVTIKKGGVPTRAKHKLILRFLDQHMNAGSIVYLHSLRGRGRAGIVAAAWLIDKGLIEKESAIDYVGRVRVLYKLSPEWIDTAAQRRFLVG